MHKLIYKAYPTLIDDGKQTIAVSIPLVGTRILHALNSFINMVLIAQLGATAVAVSALIFGTTSMLLLMIWAVLYSMAVIIGKIYGAGNKAEVGQVVTSGLLISFFIGIIFSFLLWHIDKLLIFLHQPKALVILAVPYFHALSLGIIPSLFGICFNEFAMGIMRSRLVIIWALISTPLNILLAYCLLFGKFGLPKLGIAGAAYAATFTYWGIFFGLALYFYFHKNYKDFKLFSFKRNVVALYCKKILRIGWPISLQLGAIAMSYSFLTYMMGWLGKTALAAHHVTNQWVTLVIMVPYGVAQASGVLVAKAVGEKRKLIVSIGYAGVIIGCGVVLIASLLYWIMPNYLISVYLNLHDALNQPIISLAVLLLAFMGIIQLTDCIGVIVTGALRGFHDTTIPMLIGVVMNWLLSIPLGYLLAFNFHLGAVGLYLGFVAGSVCSAAALMYRFGVLCRSFG